MPAAAARSSYGKRHDWAATAGVTQVFTPNAQVQANLGYTRSQGYLSNPYKLVEVAFIDPEQQFLAPSPDVQYVNVDSILEKRPDLRKQWLWNIRYAQYIEATDAGLHLNYAYFRDDWGIRAHTFEVEWAQPFGAGWMFTPMVRYYTQTAASFYTPYLVTEPGPIHDGPIRSRAARRPVRSVASCRPTIPATIGSPRSARWAAASPSARQFAKGVTASLGYAYFEHAGKPQVGRRRRRVPTRISTGGSSTRR